MTRPEAATVAMRRAMAGEMRQQGMSHRAIAAELGISKDTVRRDLEAVARANLRHDEPLAHPPGAHTAAAALARAARAIDTDRLMGTDRVYLLAALNLTADALTALGPGDSMTRRQLHVLADRLHDLADHKQEVTP